MNADRANFQKTMEQNMLRIVLRRSIQEHRDPEKKESYGHSQGQQNENTQAIYVVDNTTDIVEV